MTIGIIMTVTGIFGMVVFLYLAYKIANTPLEDEKIKLFSNSYKKDISIKNITGKLSIKRNTGNLTTNSEFTADLLNIQDDTEFLNLSDESDDTELLNESDDTELLNI